MKLNPKANSIRRTPDPFLAILSLVVLPPLAGADPVIVPAETRTAILFVENTESLHPLDSAWDACPQEPLLIEDQGTLLINSLCRSSTGNSTEDFTALLDRALAHCGALTGFQNCFDPVHYRSSAPPLVSPAEALLKLQAAQDSFRQFKINLASECCQGTGVHAQCIRNFQTTGLSFSSGDGAFSHYSNEIGPEELQNGLYADNDVILEEKYLTSCRSTSCIHGLVLHELGHACQYARIGPRPAELLLNQRFCQSDSTEYSLLGSIPGFGTENTARIRQLVETVWRNSHRRHDPEFESMHEYSAALERGELTGTSVHERAGVPSGCLGSYLREAFADLVFLKHWPLGAYTVALATGDALHLPSSIPLSVITDPAVRALLCRGR